MGKGAGAHIKYCWEIQPKEGCYEAPPVQNQWYDVLPQCEDVRIIYIAIRQVNDEAAAKDIEFRSTVDGIVGTASISLANNTWWYGYWDTLADRFGFGGTLQNTAVNCCLICQDALLEIRITSPLGTNQLLQCVVKYELLLPT